MIEALIERVHRWTKEHPHSGFLKRAAVLATGTVMGQAVTVLVLPVLTRLYSPEAFGIFATYSSILMTLTVVACLRFDLTVSLSTDDRMSINLAAIAMTACTIVASVVGIAVLSASEWIAAATGQPAIEAYLWLIPLATWFAGVYSTLQYCALRKKQAGIVARTQLTRAIGGAGTQIGIGIFRASPLGLLVGHVVYLGLGSIELARSLWLRERQLLQRVNWPSMVEAWRSYRHFPLYSVPEAILDSSIVYLPLLIVGAYGGAKEAGFMLLAQSIIGIPVSIISSNMSRLYLAEAPSRKSEGTLGKTTLSILKTMMGVGVLPFLIVCIAAPLLFPLVFGQEWHRSGVMVSWLALPTFIQFFVIPVATIMVIMNRLMAVLLLKLCGFVVVLGGTGLTAILAGQWVFEAYAITLTVFYLIYLLAVLWFSQRRGLAVCVG